MESVLVALVRNATAKISNYSYETLVQKSRAFSGLQEPLVKRPDLPPQLEAVVWRALRRDPAPRKTP